MEKQELQEPTAARGEPPELEWPHERLIKPAKRRLKVRDLAASAPIVHILAARDLKLRYKQSLLGPLWLVFQPMALLAAFLVAFRGLADVKTAGIPYVLFALVGLSIWSYFQSAMTIGTASMVTNASWVRFTPCPRPAFPLGSIIASLPAFAVPAAAALLATLATGHLSPRVLLLPLAVLWLMLLATAAAGISSSLNVRYRDIMAALPFLLQVGVFVAPVGYPIAELSPEVRALVELNPLTGIIETARWMTLSGYEITFRPVAWSLAVTALTAVGGWRLFTRLETTMADEI